MPRSTQVAGDVPLPAEAAARLWSDVDRWPSFVEGFARELERGPRWPDRGEKVVWESGPGGRGRVTEKVVERTGLTFATQVFEERLTGVQRATFEQLPDGEGSWMVLSLEYDLVRGGPLGAVTDFLFIRRALGDSLRRTMRRFVIEAQDEAGLR